MTFVLDMVLGKICWYKFVHLQHRIRYNLCIQLIIIFLEVKHLSYNTDSKFKLKFMANKIIFYSNVKIKQWLLYYIGWISRPFWCAWAMWHAFGAWVNEYWWYVNSEGVQLFISIKPMVAYGFSLKYGKKKLQNLKLCYKQRSP